MRVEGSRAHTAAREESELTVSLIVSAAANESRLRAKEIDGILGVRPGIGAALVRLNAHRRLSHSVKDFVGPDRGSHSSPPG